MASGVGGATFFAPIFILGLQLSPEVAIGTGLITEVFGFASGVGAYVRKRLIDYRLGTALLVVTIPAAVVGSWLSGVLDPGFLKVILGTGLFVVALSFLRTPDGKDVDRADKAIDEEYGEKAETCLIAADGEEIRYTVCNRAEGRVIARIGGLFVGLISTGLGELNGYFLLQRCRVPSKVSVATSVFVVAFTALSAAIGPTSCSSSRWAATRSRPSSVSSSLPSRASCWEPSWVPRSPAVSRSTSWSGRSGCSSS